MTLSIRNAEADALARRLAQIDKTFGKGAIRYSKPEHIDFKVVESMLRATAASIGVVC